MPPKQNYEAVSKDFTPDLFSHQEGLVSTRFAYQALELYAKENSKRGFASNKLAREIADLALQGYPAYSPEIQSVENRRYHTLEKADTLAMSAKTLFAASIGVETETAEILDHRDAVHTYVTAKNPYLKRMLNRSYRTFYHLYGGPTNAKRRDAVRNGDRAIIIPAYSRMDLYYDRQMYEQEHPKQPEPGLHAFYELSPPGTTEKIPMGPDGKKLLIDALNVFGMRRGRLIYSATFDQKMKHDLTRDPPTEHTKIPPKQEGQSLKAYCDRLYPNQMVKYAKVLYARAIGYPSLRSVLMESGEWEEHAEAIDAEAKRSWKEFWSSFNGWEEDSNGNRVGCRDELIEDLKRQGIPVGNRRRGHANNYRIGQMTLDVTNR
jgi:hypothetical protein